MQFFSYFSCEFYVFRSLFLFQKIFSDADQTYQKPKEFYDKSGKVKIEVKRKKHECGTDGVENGIERIFAADLFKLEQKIRDNDQSDAESADQIVNGKIHIFYFSARIYARLLGCSTSLYG